MAFVSSQRATDRHVGGASIISVVSQHRLNGITCNLAEILGTWLGRQTLMATKSRKRTIICDDDTSRGECKLDNKPL
jgi:hypothetical protein